MPKDSSKPGKNSNAGTIEDEASVVNEGDYNQGKWTDEEHTKFLNGLVMFGKNWN